MSSKPDITDSMPDIIETPDDASQNAQDDADVRSGFKIITVENWLDPDPLSGSIVRMDIRDGSVYPVDGRDWIRYVNGVPLSLFVPQEVRDAFGLFGGCGWLRVFLLSTVYDRSAAGIARCRLRRGSLVLCQE